MLSRMAVYLPWLILLGCQTTQDPSKLSAFRPEKLHIYDVEPAQNDELHSTLKDIKPTPKNSSYYTLSGLLQCHKDAALRSCFVRSRLPSFPYLSERVRLSEDSAEALWAILSADRIKLAEARIIVADIRCDHIANTMPPYAQNTKCELVHPRLINEIIFSDEDAMDLVDLFTKKRKWGAQDETFSGKIRCQLHSGPETSSCQLDTQEESAKESLIPTQTTEMIATRLLHALQEKWAIENLITKKPFDPPTSLITDLRCDIKFVKTKTRTIKAEICWASL